MALPAPQAVSSLQTMSPSSSLTQGIAQLLGWERLRVGLWAQEDFASCKGCPGLESLKKTADLAYGKLCFLARLLSHR